MRALLFLIGLLSALAFGGGCDRSKGQGGEALIAAAASMRVVMPDLVQAFMAQHPGASIVVSYGSSGELKRQVEAGAPVDGVIFASAAPLDDLIKQGKVDAATRRVIATNTLVLIGPKGAKPLSAAKPLSFSTLDALPQGERLAIGDPGSVPAGQYARTMLQAMGTWSALSREGRLVLGGDVGAVLAYARRGEVRAAIVYRTDILGVDDVIVLDEARGPEAPRVEVVVGAVKGAKPAAQELLQFLTSPDAQKMLAAKGFGPP